VSSNPIPCHFTDKGSRRNTEKERQNLQSDRERRNTILRAHETELHQLQLRETDLRSQVREKESLKKGVEAMHLEMTSVASQLKVNRTCSLHKQGIDRHQELDVQILEGQGPIDTLDQEHQATQTEFNVKLSQAQQVAQELSKSTDKLGDASKHIERRVSCCFQTLQQPLMYLDSVIYETSAVKGFRTVPKP